MDESMFPALPADLSALDDSELDALRAEYLAVVRQVRAGDETTIGERSAEEVIAELTAGVEALEQIKSEITTRAEAEQNFSQSLEELATRAGVTEDETPEPEATEELAAETEAEEAAQPEAVAAAAKPIRRPLPERNRRHRARESAEFSNQPVLRASNLLSGIVDPGTPLDSKSLGKVLADVVKTNRAPNGLKLVVASAAYPYPEDRQLERSSLGANAEKIWGVTSPRALIASGGLCAPLTPIYDLPGVESPVREALANFQATRGGAQVPANPTIVDYEDAVGVVTAANDELGGTNAVKSCMRIDCPVFDEVTVDSIYSCIEAGNLTARAYPELMARIDELVRANHARLADGKLLTEIRSGSTIVSTSDYTSSAGAVSTLFGDIIKAAAAMRSRHRMAADTTLRVLLPAVVIDLLQLDIIRMPYDSFGRTREGVAALLGLAGVNASFYLDERDGGSTIAGAQTAGALNALPATIEWAIYPEGSWLHLDSGTLDLGVVRDSTLNSTNDFQIFAETWENAAFVGVESLWITSNVCSSGTLSAPVDASDLYC
jgi:hypothetical protein